MLKYVLLIAIAVGHAQGQCDPETSPATCEHDSATIPWGACPAGEIRKARAYYGRRDQTTCIAGRPQPEYQFTGCHSPADEDTMSEIVTNLCNAGAGGTCQIEASNDVFGDPCYLTYKYLKICSYCETMPTPAPTTGQCNIEASPATCEHDSATIPWDACPSGQTRKARAYYGRRDRTTCIAGRPQSQYQKTDCYSPANEDAMSDTVTNWCNSNTVAGGTCQIAASNSVFGDPCYLTYKYLKVCTYCDVVEESCDPKGSEGLLTCEWKYAKFLWDTCPHGLVRKANAVWGREAGDNSTCVDQVPWIVLQNLDCPGDDVAASAAVTAWCNVPEHIKSNGKCKIRAANKKVGGDPCVETFKYLRTCTYCGFP